MNEYASDFKWNGYNAQFNSFWEVINAKQSNKIIDVWHAYNDNSDNEQYQPYLSYKLQHIVTHCISLHCVITVQYHVITAIVQVRNYIAHKLFSKPHTEH